MKIFRSGLEARESLAPGAMILPLNNLAGLKIFRRRRADRVVAVPVKIEFETRAGRKLFFPALRTMLRRAA